MKFKRIYPGYYRAEATTVLEQDGDKETVPIVIYVRHMPEWRGPNKWAVEIEAKREDYTSKLVELTDMVSSTKEQALEYIRVAVERGWKYHRSIGWAGR